MGSAFQTEVESFSIDKTKQTIEALAMSETPTTDFIESLGIIFQNEGLPRIAGRALGYLILAEEARSFTDLVEALQVSKGSVSTNTRLLVELGAVERTAKAGDRQDYFRLADSPYVELLQRGAERATRSREELRRAAENLSPRDRRTRERLSDLIFFFAAAAEASEEAAKKVRNRRSSEKSKLK